MNLRRSCTLLIALLLATATAGSATAAIHKVSPGESIQAAIDAAAPGDMIIVSPGIYEEAGNADYGLRISTPNLRLLGSVDESLGDAGRVVVRQTGTQFTGVYAAPAGCGPELGVGECPDELNGFYIRGFVVEGFGKNGIQTRFVRNFKIADSVSAGNGFDNGNGIYPTISANGLVLNNLSYGSADTAMWVAASENVRVIGNELHSSAIGFEITVSNDVWVKNNVIYGNTVGIGLFHPNAAGNTQLPVMENWVIQNNHIYENNVPGLAYPGSFQEGLPPGVGILLLGVSNNTIVGNLVENNDLVGIGVMGWCTATLLGDPARNCTNSPPQAPPEANGNLVAENFVVGNGTAPLVPEISFLAADLTYLSLVEASAGNCFIDNGPEGYTHFSSEADGELPTDGC